MEATTCYESWLIENKIFHSIIIALEVGCEFETLSNASSNKQDNINVKALGADLESSGIQKIFTLISSDTPFETPASFCIHRKYIGTPT